MKTKLGQLVLSGVLKTKLAQELVETRKEVPERDVLEILRLYSYQDNERNTNSDSYIIAEDADANKASDIEDISEMANIDGSQQPYKFSMRDENGNEKSYRFAVYKVMFQPNENIEISDSKALVDGQNVVLQADFIRDLITQGKADKYLSGVENVNDPSEKFNYELVGIEEAEAKKAFVLDVDEKGNIMPQDQFDKIKADYQNYVSRLKKQVNKYNEDIAREINEKSGEQAGGEMPPMGAPMPSGDMGMGGAPPLPV